MRSSPLRFALTLALSLSGAGAALAADAPANPKDPQLAPATRAPRELGGWDEARALLTTRSTDLRATATGIDRAEGRWRQALSTLFPNARLTAVLGYDLLNPDLPVLGAAAAAAAPGGGKPTTPTGVAAATLTQKVVDFGAWRGLDTAEAGKAGAEADLAAARRRITQGLARALVATVAAERVAQLNRLSLQQALDRAALTKRVTELGAGTQLDLVRVRQDVSLARAALLGGDQQLWQTREALGLALGLDEEIGVREGFSLDGLLVELRRSCVALGQDDARAEVRASEAGLKAARSARSQASAGYLPTLDLTTTLAAVTTTPAPGEFASWNIAAVLTVPLWEGGLRDGLIHERSAAEKQAEVGVEAVRRATALEATHARRQLTTAEAVLAAVREARDLAREQDHLTQRSFEIGKATSLDLIVSAAALRNAELTVALREFEWVQAGLDAYLSTAECQP
jgi:outer membrane protein TolC